ncbi:hypothetical protein TA3x_000870 [Tundrisphaera sp. TA3]|uniref:hypothetical protein n=1 Tax=Tundrisphaera sp. TA3 TaxID=3435775 RepID=UPI003EB9232E
MTFSFSSLIRLTALLSIAATMFAVSLSRVDRQTSDTRTRSAPGVIQLNGYYLKNISRDSQWFDVDSGRIKTMTMASGDLVETSSRAPWVDRRGQSQIVGRFSVRSSPGPLSTSLDFGLARYSYPDGRLLDRVSTDVMPIAPPAWYPGTRARVLYVAGNGHLYEFDFEGDRMRSEIEPKPHRITWGCRPPGEGEPFLTEVRWSDDPRMASFPLVTLRRRLIDAEGRQEFTRTQIWWLKLDPAGSTVLAAGPLIDGDAGDQDEHSPAITTLPDGRLAASFLIHEAETSAWRARVGVIREASAGVPPSLAAKAVRTLDGELQPTTTAFSSDGRYLSVMLGSDAEHARPVRLPTGLGLVPETGPISIAGRTPGQPGG